MRRIQWTLGLMICLLLLKGLTVFAVGSIEPQELKNVKIAIDSGKQVSISGKMPSGIGQKIVISMSNSENQVKYTNCILCDKEGAFSVSFSAKEFPFGNYKIKIGGDGIYTPITAAIIVPPTICFLELKPVVDGSQRFTLSGRISSGADKKVSLVLLDPNDLPIYLNSIYSKKDGEFTFVCPLGEKENGEYTAKLCGEGMGKNFTVSFSIGESSGNAELSDIRTDDGALNQPFDPYQNSYYMVVPPQTEAITIYPVASDLNASVSVQGKSVSFGAEPSKVYLTEQTTDVKITVTSQDGQEKNTYLLKVCQGRVDTLTDITASATEDGLVKVSGKTSAGEKETVTAMITDPEGDCQYINSVLSQKDGRFAFSYKMVKPPAGTYFVQLAGDQVPEIVTTSFVYMPPTAELRERGDHDRGGGGALKYSITIDDIELKDIIIPSTFSAASGTTITLSVASPHHVSYYIYNDGSGYVPLNGPTFVMPAANVKIKAVLVD